MLYNTKVSNQRKIYEKENRDLLGEDELRRVHSTGRLTRLVLAKITSVSDSPHILRDVLRR